jgi:aminocarboxymuconate-semialdehyde decarboxylase
VGGLIATGAMQRHPDLSLLASHGGGSLITSLPRLDYMRRTTPALQELLPATPAEYARRLWYDPLLFDAALLAVLADVVGPDRIVLGTDYPFMATDPVAFLDEPQLPTGLAAAIRSTNPTRLLESVSQPAPKGSTHHDQ